jgi:hypothetical protein
MFYDRRTEPTPKCREGSTPRCSETDTYRAALSPPLRGAFQSIESNTRSSAGARTAAVNFLFRRDNVIIVRRSQGC